MELGTSSETIKSYKLPQARQAKKAFKSFIRSSFTVAGGDTDAIIRLIDECNQEVLEMDKITLYEKNSKEMADSYIHTMNYILKHQLFPLRKYEYDQLEELEINIKETIQKVLDPPTLNKLHQAHQGILDVLETKKDKKQSEPTKTNLKGRNEK